MSIFSFTHSDFKMLVRQTGKNQGLFGKGLNTFSDLSEFQTYAEDKINNLVWLVIVLKRVAL